MKKINFVLYVENSSPRLKKFNSIKTLRKFVADFQKKHRDTGLEDGYWLDLVATDVGELEIYTDAQLEE